MQVLMILYMAVERIFDEEDVSYLLEKINNMAQ